MGILFYMIQDIYPLKLHNEYLPRSPRQGDYLFAFAGSQVIVKPDETFFRYEDLAAYSSFVYLFEINSTGFFLIEEPEAAHVSLNIRQMRSYEPKHLGFAAVTAWQLYTWYPALPLLSRGCRAPTCLRGLSGGCGKTLPGRGIRS